MYTHTHVQAADGGFLCDISAAWASRGDTWIYFIILFS